MPNPLSEQCTAKSKRSGERCRRLVVGGGVCYTHGGAARQVAAKREQRVLVADARAAAAAEPVVLERAEPEEVLIRLLDDVTRILEQIKSELHGNVVSPALLAVAGEWFDRVARVAKTVIDGDVSQKLHARIGWLAQDRAATVWGHLAAIVAESPLTAGRKAELWQARFDGLEMIKDGRAPFRLAGDELHRFGDGLLEAAALEKAAAEGFPWGDPEPDADSDRVPYLFPVDGSGNGLVS